jgi:hypothetical protein
VMPRAAEDFIDLRVDELVFEQASLLHFEAKNLRYV